MNKHKICYLIIAFVITISISGKSVPVLAQDPPPIPEITIEEFPFYIPGASGLAVAPNGDVWVAEWGGHAIGRLSTDGTFTHYYTPNGPNTLDVAIGADSNIWFTEILYGEPPGGNIGMITPDGIITEFPIPTRTQFSPHNLTLGPDGNIWFTESGGNKIGKITPDGVFTEYLVSIGEPHGITTGPDGNIWFTGYGTGRVGKITLDGDYTAYEVGASGPFEITAGPDGNIWFTEYWGPNVYRITTDGIVTRFPISSGVGTRGITAGPDGNIWFTEPQNNKIGRISPDGVMTEYTIPTENSWPCYITSGPDGTLWFSEHFGGKIGRIKLNLNHPPIISSMIASVAPEQLGQSIDATLEFSDPDLVDTHTVTWDWGDGTTTTAPATVPSVTTSHTYTATGVYTIFATITDATGESANATAQQYVVIYDPDGGFVTGGGWIDSPEGAYTADTSLAGKATFGFVSKYQKGASVPTGNTEFQFKVADLNFKSSSYDWLVVAGSTANYKGIGIINGTGEYGFMLSAIDGTPDKFRIKIWDKATEEVVYDNQIDAEEDSAPETAIQGGSIVVHKEK